MVLAIGSDLTWEREGLDRTSIDFSDGQKALIAAVTAAARGPVIALVFSGGAMDFTVLLRNPKIQAAFHLGQPSVQVLAAGDLIFGRTLAGGKASPAGRMSQMSYPANFVNEVSMFDFGMRPGKSAWPPMFHNPGRTYRFYTGDAVVPFGFGLSYTTWKYVPWVSATTMQDGLPLFDLADVRASIAEPQTVGHIAAKLKAAAVSLYVNVTNTGHVDSDDIVLGFDVPIGAGKNGAPIQELFAFERVHVRAGQTVTVYLPAPGLSFTQTDQNGLRRFVPGTYTVRFGVQETAAFGQGFAETQIVVQ